MAVESAVDGGVVFKVLDAMDAPHTGRILRLRLQTGEAPPVKWIKGRTFHAEGPGGSSCDVRVTGFAVFGGKPSDDRLARTGRVDVHVTGGESIGLGWSLRP